MYRYKSSCSVTENSEAGGKGEGIKDGDEEDDDLDESEDVYNYDYDDSNDDDNIKPIGHQHSKEDELKSVASHDSTSPSTHKERVRFSFSEEKVDNSTLRRNRNNTLPNPRYSYHNSIDTPNRHHHSIDTPSSKSNFSYDSNINNNQPFNLSLNNPNTSNSPDYSKAGSPDRPKLKKYVSYKSHQNAHALRDPDTIDDAFRRARTYSTDVLTYFGRSGKNLEKEVESLVNFNNNFDINSERSNSERSNSDPDTNLDSNLKPDTFPVPNHNVNSNDNTPPSENSGSPKIKNNQL
jgi:hypothetical protein